jgi:hypothetical protein
MVLIRKSIDIVSPSDGQHYTDIVKYEKSLDQKGQYIMSDREFKDMRDKLRDESASRPKKVDETNHVHIDLANDRIIKSKRDL